MAVRCQPLLSHTLALVQHPSSPSPTRMRSLKLYEHPELKAEDEDVSLLTTICFVLALVVVAAIFILSLSCLLLWDDCKTCEYL